MAHLFIIAGHGDGDPGASGNGYTEAERVRALAAKIGTYGGDDVTVGDTSRDWYKDKLINNLNIPKDWQIAELHMDGDDNASAHGGHVIIKAGYDPDSYDTALAEFISGILPGRSEIIVKRDNLANPKRAAAKGYPYSLLECGFITNAEDVAIFNREIDDIAKGILNVFGISTGSSARYALHSFGESRKIYDNQTKSYIKNQWCEINGKWYYAGSNEYLLSKWQNNLDGRKKVYFIAPDWHLHAGWLSFGSTKYYCRSNGDVAVGFYKIGNEVYYFDGDGVRQSGWQTIDGKRYYLNPERSDAAQMGWASFCDKKYYFNPNNNGAAQVGWASFSSDKYYFDEDGVMKTGWQEIDGKKYWFDATTGKMLKGLITFGDTWYYLSPEDGHLMYTKENGTLY